MKDAQELKDRDPKSSLIDGNNNSGSSVFEAVIECCYLDLKVQLAIVVFYSIQQEASEAGRKMM